MNVQKTVSALAAALVLAGAVSLPALAAEQTAPAPESAAYGYPLERNGAAAAADVPVMVPLRAVAEALGFTVTWNGDGTVTVDSGEMHSVITIGEDRYQAVTSIEGAVGATDPLQLGAPPYVIQGTTYVPLKLFDVLLGSGAVTLDGGRIAVRTASDPGSTQLPDPWTELDTPEAAAEAAGFDLTLPAEADRFAERVYRVLPSGSAPLLEVLCRTGDDRLILRKASGSGDISGDYTAYAQEQVTAVGDRSVTMRGADGRFSLAVWTDGGYAYSVCADTPLSGGDMAALIRQIR